jgi:AcrR family transcriptional regulator
MPRVSEQYIQRRRKEIIDAAWRCFARDGFHATTMDDVVVASRSSPSVVYRWFRSKDELVSAVIVEALAGVVATMTEIRSTEPPPSLPDALRRLLESALAQTAQGDQDLMALPLQAWTEALRNPEVNALVVQPYQELLDGLADLVKRHQARGNIGIEVDHTDLARPLFSLIPGFLMQNLLIGPVDPARYVASFSALLEPGPADRPAAPPS